MRSCRGEVEVTGQRRAEERAWGDGRADKVLESCAAQAASCAWRKVGAAFPGGGSFGGEDPPPVSLPREGGLASAAAAVSLSAPCPISSLWPTRLPSPPRPSAGSGVGVLRKEAPRLSPHTYTPSLQWKRVQLGFRELPDPCVRFTWETWLLSIASMPACETKLYYAVTSHKVREWGRAGACLQAAAFTRCPEFQTLLPPPIFSTRFLA